MNNIGNYLAILKTAKEVLKVCQRADDSAGTQTAMSIYTLAFYELIRTGMPHTMENNEVIIEADGERYSLSGSNDAVRETKLQERVKEPAAATSSDEPVPRKEDTPAPAAASEQMETEEDITDDDFAPDTTKIPEKKKKEQPEAEIRTEAPAAKAKPEDPDELPYIGPDTPTLKKKDFTFDFIAALVKGKAGGRRTKAEFLVMPIRIDKEEPEILVGLIKDKKTIVTKSIGTKPAVVEMGAYQFKIEGKMNDGQFESRCELTGEHADKATIETKITHFGKKGHVTLNDRDSNTYIHILPVAFANNEQNNADIIYYINSNGEEIMGGTNSEGPAVFNCGGEKLELVSRWKGDTLYSMVKPSEE